MAESIVSDLIVKVLEFLGQSAVERIAPYFGGRGRLNELQLTMEMIQARLYDAERRQETEEGALIRSWLKRLKRVMCRLEDLLEELTTVGDEQDEQRASAKLTKAVCFLPSKLSSLKMNKTLFLETQEIMREFDLITSNMDSLHFNLHAIDQERRALNVINGREETYSFIPEEEVIGRDEDKNVILRMLFECDHVKKDLSVIPIVGMGGLGKTTLAQLVFNDKQVQQHFELKCWACISDQISGFKELAGKVFHSITGRQWQCLSIEQLQLQLREAVNGKKFLLVLDDVWDDNHETWVCLERLFRGGKQGSKILVTTRSKVVASSMCTIEPYILSSLSEEKSWALFKSIAFKDRQDGMNPNLISIGQEIIKKCGNVPLAIRTIAGLLYSRDMEEDWVHFSDREIGMTEQTQAGIIQTLKISYYHLAPQQKQCFAYCSLFPKDYSFNIKKLIQLWMAQGFAKSLNDGHMCFMDLLRRCFFQNVRIGRHCNDTEICQMHDLIHDLAQMVGDECLLVDGSQKNVNSNVRHVHVVNPWVLGSQSGLWFSALDIRSYFAYHQLVLSELFSSLRRLRTLDLGHQPYEKLPDSIGKLKHLRYLRVRVLSHDLPKGITKLQYLQTLDVRGSSELTELPTELYKLARLKYLQIVVPNPDAISGGDICPLIDMPPRFGELISLQSVDAFIVGEKNGLDALSRMKLVGKLSILYKKHRQNAISEAINANLKGKKLTDLLLYFADGRESVMDADELLECLQPPLTLKHLIVKNWEGVSFPSWGIDELPKLVSMRILNCTKCRHLPPFSQLPHIKILKIMNCGGLDLWDVKHEDGDGGNGNSVVSSPWACLKNLHSLTLSRISKLQSLPSGIGSLAALQELSIWHLDDLKTLPESIGLLTQLRVLSINVCHKLEALPKSIQDLTALQKLRLNLCSLLRTRCKVPNGDDWPLIQHIPCKDIS